MEPALVVFIALRKSHSWQLQPMKADFPQILYTSSLLVARRDVCHTTPARASHLIVLLPFLTGWGSYLNPYCTLFINCKTMLCWIFSSTNHNKSDKTTLFITQFENKMFIRVSLPDFGECLMSTDHEIISLCVSVFESEDFYFQLTS